MNFKSDKILLRLFFIIFSLGICLAVCFYHGIAGKNRISQLTGEMIRDGKLTARFWEVQICQSDILILSKYGYRIRLNSQDHQKNINIGDKVSFIAYSEKNGTESTLWLPDKIHFHGTSTFKFLISGIAVLFVLLLCLRHFRFTTTSWSLKFKEN